MYVEPGTRAGAAAGAVGGRAGHVFLDQQSAGPSLPAPPTLCSFAPPPRLFRREAARPGGRANSHPCLPPAHQPRGRAGVEQPQAAGKGAMTTPASTFPIFSSGQRWVGGVARPPARGLGRKGRRTVAAVRAPLPEEERARCSEGRTARGERSESAGEALRWT